MPIVFRNLGVRVVHKNQTKQILSGCTAAIPAGSIVTLMGPSGSGKSTLLDQLSLRKNTGILEGDLFIGGRRPSQSFVRRNTAYAEQANTLIGNLTVREFLMYTAFLKNDMKEDRRRKEERVTSLVSGLGLNDCADTFIGDELNRGISGGQAKRVSVAAQLVTEPAILYLDEPTSGLDSFSAHETMQLVRQYCKQRGVTVICTIHSPSARTLAMFDSLLLLLDGKQIFFGSLRTNESIESMIHFMQSCLPEPPMFTRFDNPAEYVVNITTAANRRCEQNYFIDGYANSKLKIENDSLVERVIKEFRDVNASHIDYSLKESGQQANASFKRSASRSSSRQKLSDTVGKYDEDDVVMCLKRESLDLDDFIGYDVLQEPHTHEQKYAGGTRTPVWWALGTMMQYRTRANFKDGGFLGARLTEKMIQGFIISTLYTGIGNNTDQQSIVDQSAMLFIAITLPAFGAAAYIPAIAGEKRTYYREVQDALYTPLAYLIFKILEELFVAIIAALIFTLLLYFPLQMQGSYALVFLSYLTVLLNGIVLAYAIAAATPTETAANAALPLYVVSLLFFCGFLANYDRIPPGWTWYSYIDFLRYAWSALMIDQFEALGDPLFNSNETVTQYYNLPNTSAWTQYGVLWAFFAVLFTCAWLALKFIRHQNR